MSRIPFESKELERNSSKGMGSNNNWNPIYQHRLKNYIFESDRILLFLLGCNPIKQLPIFQSSPRISSRNSYFSRGSRDRYNKSLFSVRSRGTKHPNSIGRRSWNLVGRTQMIVQHFSQKLIGEIQSDNTCCEFFHELFHSSPQFRGIFFNSNKILLWNLETSSSWQTKNNQGNKCVD